MSSSEEDELDTKIEELFELLESYGLDAEELEAKSTFEILSSMTSFAKLLHTLEQYPNHGKSVAHMRQYFFRKLWSDDRLSPPWTQLVDRLFPGELLSSSDFERFAAENAEEILAWEEAHKDLKSAVQMVGQILDEFAYMPLDEDLSVLELLIDLLVFFWYMNRRHGDVWPIDQQEEALQGRAMGIITESSDPGHEAWPHVLGLFKAPQEQR